MVRLQSALFLNDTARIVQLVYSIDKERKN